MSRQSGFTLIELIITMVIMGIILTVGSMFFSTMLRGFTTARLSSEIAQDAQIAMDRIVYEIKNATGQAGGDTITFTANTSIVFESSAVALAGTTRTIELAGTNLVLDVDATDYLLMENVNAFTLGLSENDIDGNPADNEISSVNISFSVTNYGGTFSIQVAPREFIRK